MHLLDRLIDRLSRFGIVVDFGDFSPDCIYLYLPLEVADFLFEVDASYALASNNPYGVYRTQRDSDGPRGLGIDIGRLPISENPDIGCENECVRLLALAALIDFLPDVLRKALT